MEDLKVKAFHKEIPPNVGMTSKIKKIEMESRTCGK